MSKDLTIQLQVEELTKKARLELEKKNNEILKPIKIQLARETFLGYVKYMTPDIERPPFQLDFIQKLQDCTDGKISRLMVCMPPGHGKSSLLELWASWSLGREPREQFFNVSYTTGAATDSSEKVKIWCQKEEFAEVFPDFKFGSKETQEAWTVDKVSKSLGDERGKYEAKGITSGVGGKRFTKGIVDDPFGGSEDANSPTMQEKVKEAFFRNFLTREHNGKVDIPKVVIVVSTRWNINDLIGAIEELEANPDFIALGLTKFERVIYQAKQEDGTYLWDTPEMIKKYKMMEVSDVAGFEALYQQNPLKAMGAIFKKSNFKYFNLSNFQDGKLNKDDFYFCAAIDPATSSAKGSDDAVGVIAGIHKYSNDIYVLGLCGGIMGPSEFYNEFFTMLYGVESQGFKINFISIEQVAINKAQTKFKQDFVAEMKRRGIFTSLYDYVPKEEKLDRIRYQLEPLFQQGKLYFLNRNDIDWNQGFKKLEDELLKFPTMSHDDYPDAVTQAVIQLLSQFMGLTRRSERKERDSNRKERKYRFLING